MAKSLNKTSQEDLDHKLYYACVDGDIPKVEALIAKGASVSYRGEGGKTPVAVAAYLDHGELVRTLITKHKADPETYDEKDCSALFEACGQGNVSAVKALIESGADVESLTKKGASTFLVACNVGNMEILQYLISRGANRNIVYKEHTGKTLAEKEKHQNVVQYLLELDQYDDKMQQSYDKIIEVEFSKFSIHGAAGSGKTCLQHLLLSEDPPCERESTDVSTAAVRGMRDMKTSVMANTTSTAAAGGIKRVDGEKSMELLVQQTKSKLTLESEPLQTSEGATPLNSVVCDGGSKVKKLCTVFKKKKKKTPPQQQQPTASPIVDPTTSDDCLKSFTSCGMLSLLPSSSDDSSFILRWVYGTDSGGQPAFQDIAPAFVRHCSVVVLTLKLNEKLSDYPDMEYKHKGFLVKEPGRKQFTNLEMVLNLARSLSSIRQMKCSGINSSRCSPKLIIVGTFHDRMDSCAESLGDKNETLKKALTPFQDSLILTPEGHHIHPIYNLVKRREGREEKSKELCEVILNSYGAKQTSSIRLSHLMFQFEIFMYAESEGKDILTIEECYKVGRSVRIDNEEDVKDALTYLDCLGVLLYFHPILPDLVFVKPQVILKHLSDLISLVSFKEEQIMKLFPNYAIHWTGSERRHLFTNACFNRRVLEVLFNPKSIFTVNHFIDLMINLLVIAEVPCTRTREVNYFLPCALPWKEFTEDELDSLFHSDSAPISLFWKDSSIIPYGIFLGTVNALLSYDEGHVRFQLHMPEGTEPTAGGTPPMLNQRNAIFLFCEPCNGHVMLIDRVTHVELRYRGPEPGTYCPMILSAIKCCIARAANTYLYDDSILMAVEECFLSSCDSDPSKHVFRVFHVARQLESNSHYRGSCRLHSSIVSLSKNQLKWFESNTQCIDLRKLPKDRQLDMEDYPKILDCLKPLMNNWKTFASYLGLQYYQIDTIEKDRLQRRIGGQIDCFHDMIHQWLKNDNDCTVEKIEKALEKMHYNINL